MNNSELIRGSLSERRFIAGVAMAAVGGLLAIGGMVISAVSAVASARRWARHLDPPPRAVARARWQQAKAAGAAGAGAWRVAAMPSGRHSDAIRTPAPMSRG